MAGVRNLRQVEAVDRARLLDVAAYDISLDLTDGAGYPGEGTFRSTTEVRVHLRRAGRRHLHRAGRRRCSGRRRSTAPPSTRRGWSAETGLRLPGLAADNVLVVDADCAYSNTGQGLHRSRRPGRQGGVPLQPVRDGRRAAGLRLLRPARPEGRLHLARDRAGALEGHLQLAGRRTEPAGDGRKTVHFAPSARMSTYITALCAGPYHEVPRHATTASTWAFRAAQSMKQYLDADDIFLITKQGFDFFHEQFGVRYPLPKYDQVVRAGVQRRRDGELRLRRARRAALHLPLAGHRLRVRAARQHDPARDGPHVVRRPGHHALVGRPVAERVVRGVGQPLVQHPRRPASPTRGPRSCRSARTGATGRTSCPPPTRSTATCPTSRRSRSTSTASRTPRAPASSSSWSRTSGIDAFLTGLRAYFQQHAWGNATFDDLLSALEAASGKELREFAAQWLETAQVNTLRPEVTDRPPDGTYDQVAVRAGGAGRLPDAAHPPHRHRPVRPGRRRAWSAAS